MKKIMLITAGIFMLAGCSNSPVNPNEAKLASTQNIFAYKTAGADTAQVTVVRDSGMVAAGCDVITSVNGTKSLKLSSGEKGILYVPQGNASFNAEFDCPLGNGEPSPTLNIFLAKDMPVYLRVRTDQISGVNITETTADNPSFVCPDPTKNLDRSLSGTKDAFILYMRSYSSLFESLRSSARSASVKYNNGSLQECLSKNSVQVKTKMDIAFKELRNKTKNEEEKSALIDAYSKFLTTIDPSMSINQINTLQAPFNAAVNKYELY